jgi:hypothetical protein
MGEYQVRRPFRISLQEPVEILPRRDAIDLSHLIPTTSASRRIQQGSQPYRRPAEPARLQLDYNPHIGGESTIVAVELKALAPTLERRFAALFSGADSHYGSNRRQHIRSTMPTLLDDRRHQRKLVCS